jgi:DNA replication protein DnaC
MRAARESALLKLENLRRENQKKTEENFKTAANSVPEIIKIKQKLASLGARLAGCAIFKQFKTFPDDFDEPLENISKISEQIEKSLPGFGKLSEQFKTIPDGLNNTLKETRATAEKISEQLKMIPDNFSGPPPNKTKQIVQIIKNPYFESVREQIKNLQDERAALLAKNGFPGNFLKDVVSCETCGDTGFSGGKKCACLKKLELLELKKLANIPAKLKDVTFKNTKFDVFGYDAPTLKSVKKAYRAAYDFAREVGENYGNLLIFGETGTGKTHLSACVASLVLERGKSVYYAAAYKLFRAIEDVKFAKVGAEKSRRSADMAMSADLLIIDDLSTEFVTTFTISALYDVINTRMMDELPTVINTNLEIADVESVYGARVASRLFGEYKLLKLTGKDLRLLRFEKV